MENLIFSIIILAILGSSVFYIAKEKRKGVRCIGCPASGSCKRCNCHK